MLYTNTLEPVTLALLKDISGCTWAGGLRLVGGTALALQYGHRQSIDLDFFGDIGCDVDELPDLLRPFGKLTILKLTPNIRIFAIDGIKVDFVNYSYPWIDDAIIDNGITLASDKDIAAMKVNAVIGRGTKKDFIDIFYLLKKYTLEEILSMYQAKYYDGSLFRALLSMGYFDDADPQPQPKMFFEDSWSEIKREIRTQVANYKND